MNKKTIRLTESDLKNIIKESVKKVLKENHEIGEIRQVLDEIDVRELIKHGKTEVGEFEIVRLSDRLDAILELQMTNLETGKSATALYPVSDDEELTSEYYAGVERLCKKYMSVK
jgi:hypothetical protein